LHEVEHKQIELSEKKDKKSTLSPKVDDCQSRKTILQLRIDDKTEEVKQQTAAQIEPQVETKFQEKQAEKARIAAEAEQQAQTEESAKATEQPQLSEGHDEINKPAVAEVSEEDKQKQLEEEKSAIRKDLVEEQLQQSQPLQALKEEMKSLDDEISIFNREISDLERDIKDIEHFLSFDFGPGAKFSYMNDQSYTFTTPEYTYTLKPFKDITQGHTRVGSWGTWENDYTAMKYDNGERCWGGPDRSMAVALVCGGETQVLEVKEPSKCEYAMKIKTPGACKVEALELLRKSLTFKT